MQPSEVVPVVAAPWSCPRSWLTRAELFGTEAELIAGRERLVAEAREVYRVQGTASSARAYRRACDEAALALCEYRQRKRMGDI
jgi:hypothetical protein